MAQDDLKVYKFEDTQTGQIIQFEGPSDATDDEIDYFLENNYANTPSAPQEEQVAASNQVAPVPGAPRQELQTEIVQGNTGLGDVDPRFLGEDREAKLLDMMQNPEVSYDDINNYIREQANLEGRVVTGDSLAGGAGALEQYRKDLAAAGPDAQSAGIQYSEYAPQIAEAPAAEDIEQGWVPAFERAYQDAVQYGTSGILARTYHDWMDTGKESLKQQFPDATEEQLEQIHENAIASVQKQLRARNAKITENDPMIPWLAAQVLGSAGVEDFVPFVGGLSTAGRVGAAAGINSAADAGYQVADIAGDVQDEFNVKQAMLAPVIGAGFQGGIEGVSRGIARLSNGKPTPEAPDASGRIPVPTSRRGSKAYKKEIADLSGHVVNHVNETVGDWSNAPKIEVHDNFKKLDGIDDDAAGFYDSETGQVNLNTEQIAKIAKDKSMPIEDVTTALTFHESLGHYGLHQEFGDRLDDTISEWVSNAGSDFGRAIISWETKNPGQYEGRANRDLLVAEEVLADWAQKGKLPRTFYDKFANFVKDVGRRMGLDLKYSERELKAILSVTQDKVIKGRRSNVEGGGIVKYDIQSGIKENDVEVVRLEDGTTIEILKDADGNWLDTQNHKTKYGNDAPEDIKPSVADIQEGRYGLAEKPEISPEPKTETTRREQIIAASQELADTPKGGTKTIRPFPEDEPDYWRFRHVTEDDKAVTGTYRIEDGVIQDFSISSDGGPKSIGVKNIRKIARDVLKEHPNVKRIGAYRLSGARVKKGSGAEFMETNVKYMKSGEFRPGVKAANDADRTVKYDKKGRPILPGRVMGSREAYDYYTAMADYQRKRAGKYVNVNKNAYERALKSRDNYLDLAKKAQKEMMSVPSKRETRTVRPYTKQYEIDTNSGPKASSNDKYMKSPSLENISPIRREELSADELFEAENAIEVLDRIDTSPTTPLTMTELKADAAARGMNVSRLLRANDFTELSRKFLMYDIATEKLQDRVTALTAKINSGQFNLRDKERLLVESKKYADMVEKMLGIESEAGRLLRSVQETDFTRRKIDATKNILSGLKDDNILKSLEDDEVFAKFAKELADSLEASSIEGPGKVKKFTANALNYPRAIMSSTDLSAPLRQGIVFATTPTFWKSLPQMFRSLGSEVSHNAFMDDVMARPTYEKMMEADLFFSGTSGKLSQREEAFMTEWSDATPVVRQTNRAYSAFLNKLRADMFDDLYTNLVKQGADPDDKAFLKGLGAFINAGSGRGNLPKAIEGARPLLNGAFFSPGLIASRVNMLNPAWYATLPPYVRKQAIFSAVSMGSMAYSMLQLIQMSFPEVEVEYDPRSSDFGKVKIGKTRYDILGGFGQFITLGARLSTNERKTSTGEINEYGDEYKEDTRLDVGGKFFTNKTAPNVSFVFDYLRGTDAVGNEFKVGAPDYSDVESFGDFAEETTEYLTTDSAAKRMVPMFLQDYAELAKEEGWGKGAVMATPGLFGVGISTYASKNLDPEAIIEAPEGFDMEELEDGENEAVSVADGRVTLKPEARQEWERRLNTYIEYWMKEEQAKPEWSKMSKKEKAEVISEVRNDARAQTKEDMLQLLELE